MKNRLYTASLAGAIACAVLVMAAPLGATVSQEVPEINAGSISAGLGLLAAGILVLRARRKR
jgi:hypothetical protein